MIAKASNSRSMRLHQSSRMSYLVHFGKPPILRLSLAERQDVASRQGHERLLRDRREA